MTSSGVDSPTPAKTGAASLVGRVLSERYRIESVLGEGGMGAVYLAEHVLMRKRLAVKVLHPEMTRMPEMVARFEREAMAAAHIEHPNVAAATDFGKLEDGSFFLVLEYVEGTSLRDLIAQGPLATERALHIAYQMTSGLARAHALGIVHRDLKPENVMLVEREGDPNFVKVLDFGIAKVPVGEFSPERPGADGAPVLTQLGMVYGTPEYMAPEQALGQAVDARADIYALGVILFEMLSGVRPFEAESKVALLGMKVTSDPPTLATKNPNARVPDSVEALVRRMLDKEAANRFQDAREILDAIENGRMGEARTEAPMGRLNLTPTPGAARYRASLASVPRAQVSSADWVPGAGRFAEKRAQMTAWVRGAREKLPGALARVPPLGLIAGAAVAMLLLLLVSFAILGSSSRSTVSSTDGSAAPPPPLFKKLFVPATAPPEVLATASTQGTTALEELSTRFPEDPAVWRALVRSYTKDKRGADAMRAVGKLVGLNERAADDEDVVDAVTAAAQGPAEASDAAFAMMEGGLGTKGPDLLYDLSTTKGLSPRTLARVKQALAKSDVKGRMSPALSVAIELRGASGCEAKRAVLPRAKEQGDARVLGSLRTLQSPRGCGFLGLGDCWGCMRRDNVLGATIAAIEERTAK
jgi:eukaryotic-like serine/threonine-protein kinase